MRIQPLAPAALLLLAGQTALADDRAVTAEERTKLTAAVTAAGCSGGEMKFDDDGRYEVDDVQCGDGRRYDLDFDTSFKLVSKELDDD